MVTWEGGERSGTLLHISFMKAIERAALLQDMTIFSRLLCYAPMCSGNRGGLDAQFEAHEGARARKCAICSNGAGYYDRGHSVAVQHVSSLK
jgi:hypothetical protein